MQRTFGVLRKLDSGGCWDVGIIFRAGILGFLMVFCSMSLAWCGPGVLEVLMVFSSMLLAWCGPGELKRGL